MSNPWKPRKKTAAYKAYIREEKAFAFSVAEDITILMSARLSNRKSGYALGTWALMTVLASAAYTTKQDPRAEMRDICEMLNGILEDIIETKGEKNTLHG